MKNAEHCLCIGRERTQKKTLSFCYFRYARYGGKLYSARIALVAKLEQLHGFHSKMLKTSCAIALLYPLFDNIGGNSGSGCVCFKP